MSTATGVCRHCSKRVIWRHWNGHDKWTHTETGNIACHNLMPTDPGYTEAEPLVYRGHSDHQPDAESIAARLFDVPESMLSPDWRRAARARARISRRAEWDALVQDLAAQERRNARRGEWRRMTAWLRANYATTFGTLEETRPNGRPHLSECPSWYGEPCRCDDDSPEWTI